MIHLGCKKKSSCIADGLKTEKKKQREKGNCFLDTAASDLKQLKRKFCELAVSDVSCPFKKIKQEEELVDQEINSPEVGLYFMFNFSSSEAHFLEREESSRLGMIQIDEIEADGSIPLENFNHDKLTDNILTKKITVRENFLPKQKYFQPTPSRWLLTPEYVF